MGLAFQLSKLSQKEQGPKIQQLTVSENRIHNINATHAGICSFPAFIDTCWLETLGLAVNLSSDCRGLFLTPTKPRTKCVKEFRPFKESSLSYFIFVFPQRCNILLLLQSVKKMCACMHEYMKACENVSGEQSPKARLSLNSILQNY